MGGNKNTILKTNPNEDLTQKITMDTFIEKAQGSTITAIGM